MEGGGEVGFVSMSLTCQSLSLMLNVRLYRGSYTVIVCAVLVGGRGEGRG